MNATVLDDNETILCNGSNGSTVTTSEEGVLSQITGLYLPLIFRPVFVIVVIYLVWSAIDAILTTRRRNSDQFYSIEFFFLNNLLISDIVTAVCNNVVAVSVIVNTLSNPDTKGVGCYVIAASRSPTCATSLFVAVVCFDRLMFVVCHNRYIEFMTKRRRYTVVAIVWFLAIIGNLVIIFDPTMEVMTKNGVCIHRPFINHYGTVVLLLPALLAVVVVIIQNVYLFYVAYQSNAAQDRQMSVSGATASDNNNRRNQRKQESRFVRVLRMSSKSAYTAILLASFHLVFGAVFPLVEYLVCPRYEGQYIYIVLTSVVFVVFEFVNLMIHPLLYGFYVSMVRENLRHRELYLRLYQLCCTLC